MKHIYFFGDLDASAAMGLVSGLNSAGEGEEVIIHISSSGGEVPYSLAIYDAIQTCKGRVSTIGYGEVCSAASLIMCSGAKGKRYLHKNSKMMLHHPTVSDLSCQKTEDLKALAALMSDEKASLVRLYSKHTKKRQSTLQRLLQSDLWLTPEECLEFGLADHII